MKFKDGDIVIYNGKYYEIMTAHLDNLVVNYIIDRQELENVEEGVDIFHNPIKYFNAIETDQDPAYRYNPTFSVNIDEVQSVKYHRDQELKTLLDEI